MVNNFPPKELATSTSDYKIYQGIEWNGDIRAFVQGDRIFEEGLLLRYAPPRIGEKFYVEMIREHGKHGSYYESKENVAFVKGTTLHIPMTGHFGHFVLEGIARLWPIVLESGLQIDNLFIDKPLIAPSREIIERCVTSATRRVFASGNRSFHFEQLLVPSPSYLDRCDICNIHSDVCREIGRLFLPNLSWNSMPSLNIIFSRRRVFEGRRGFAHVRPSDNPDLFREYLDQGYIEILPELLSITQQMLLVNLADHIVGPVGSAFHLMLFRETAQRLRVTYFHHNEFITYSYRLIDRLLGIDSEYRLVPCATE